MKQVKLIEWIDNMVIEIKEKREKSNQSLITSKQGIVNEAIALLYKKEIGAKK